MIDSLIADLRWSARSVRSKPWWAALVVATLAGGIGATITVVSVVKAILAAPLPFPRADRLVVVDARTGAERAKVSYREYRTIADEATLFEALAPFYPTQYNVTSAGARPESLPALTTTSELFAVLGVPMLHGAAWPSTLDFRRQFTVVIGEGLWRRRYGSDPAIVGRTIRLDNYDYAVVGVVRAGADFPDRTDVFRAITNHNEEDVRRLQIVARLRPGTGFLELQQALDSVSAQLAARYPDSNTGVRLVATPLREAAVADLRGYSWLLVVAGTAVLLLTCANVSNLLLSRTFDRGGELATRRALGATPVQIARLIVLESCLLSLAGGVLGLGLAALLLRVATATIAFRLPPWVVVSLDAPAYVAAVAIALLAGALASTIPALRWSFGGASAVARSAARSGVTRSERRMRSALTAAQAAFAVLLLIGAGLTVRTVMRLTEIEPGFSPAGLLTFRVDPPWGRYPDAQTTSEFYRRAIEQLETLPGVMGAAVNQNLPIARLPDAVTRTVAVEGRPLERRGDLPPVNVQPISPRYLDVMRIPLIRGRTFSSLDVADTQPVALVNARFAERYWPGVDPVGRRFQIGGALAERPATVTAPAPSSEPVRTLTVVGIVGDVRHEHVATPPGFDVYVPVTQYFAGDAYVVVRTAVAPDTLVPAVTRAIWQVDSDQSIFDVRTMRDHVNRTIWSQRLTASLFATFALLALVLAVVGLYGVTAHALGERQREIGVRMALGARPMDVVTLVTGEAMVTVAAGATVGLVAAGALAQATSEMLYGVSSRDPLVYGASAICILLAGFVGVLVPSRRAVRINPTGVLRA
jgi:putative ABC transport system permease protein